MTKLKTTNSSIFFDKIADLLKKARKSVVQTVNQTMVYTYFEIGKTIVEEEQKGEERAEYGKQLLKELSKRLSNEFGKGFSQRNLEQMRRFYLVYGKQQTLSAKSENQKAKTVSAEFKLSWSHYVKLIRIETEEKRKFYELEARKN